MGWTTDITEQHSRDLARMNAIRAALGVALDGSLADLFYAYEAMLDGATKEAPFCKGQRVRLYSVPVINEVTNRGWLHCTHFLKKNATATVQCVQLNSLGWRVGLVFDDESRIDQDGTVIPTEYAARGVMFFNAADVRALPETEDK